MDQVPRYFEMEPTSTITRKGSKEVLMRKGGSSHKRFTASFGIILEGKFLKPHLLFSKLKNKPAVNDKCLVDVNGSGMWNAEILMDYCKNNILSRRETAFSREPTLLIIDSYGEHVKLLKENKLAKYNVFVVIVPPNLTGVLQPLDVAINRSYQRFHDSLYDQYIAEALENPELQTKAGNPKVPDYRRVSDWVVEWMDTKTSAEIIKAFQDCVPSFLPSMIRKNMIGLESLEIKARGSQAVPDIFGDLQKLCIFKLTCEAMESSLVESLGRLSSLEELDLVCKTVERLPDVFGCFSTLKTLLIESPSLQALPDTFGNFVELTTLHISTSGLRTLPDTFAQLSLEEFHLQVVTL
ncbi:hypothetical protein R1sor_012424 [Riccia sorocarpa]|uniref:DDE-1 domain-containing protein n=1 Tax=Riccia sorocarpa TaxID=122646 RepID=A0ABD3I440_9MARC